MHEFQPIPGLAGRLFGGGAAGLLRRGGGPATPEVAEVRCPRCDSANTKFCYYNNYNLAQPRHFCRACRRYWTKGGLLRNVPVGGGCWKPKPKRPATADADAGKKSAHDVLHRDAKNPRSGCAATNSKPASNASSAVDHQPSCPGRGVSTSPFASGDTPPLPVPPPAPMFADQVVAFASLFAPPPLPAFSFLAQAKAEERVAPVLAEQPSPASTAHATTFDAVRSGGGLTAGASDWPPPSATDAGIFGLTGAMAGDATLLAYWNPASWTDPEPTMYLP